MAEKSAAQIAAEQQLSQIMMNTGVQVDFTSGAPTFSADYTTLENVNQNEIASLLGVINPVTQTAEGGGFTPMQYGGTTYQTETDWNQFLTSQQQEGFQFNPETNDFAFNRTFGEQTFTDPNEWRTFANERAMQGYDWNKEQQDFSFVNFGERTFQRQLEDGSFETVKDFIDTPEKFEEFKAFKESQGFIVQVDRKPILDGSGNVIGYEPIQTRTEIIGKDEDGNDITREVPVRGATSLREVNAMQWHRDNSPNFTRFVGVNGADATVFNGAVYRLNTPADQEAFRRTVAAYTASLDTTKAKEITDAMYFMLDGGQPGVVPSDDPNLTSEFKAINYTDEQFGELSFATPEELQAYIDQKRTEGWMVTVNEDGTLRHVQMQDTSSVDPANLKSILAGLGAAAPGFMYSWDEEAAAEVERTYGVATAEAVRNAVQARIDLSNMRAEALNAFYGGKYASASKIEKFGWTGGAASDERMRMAYMNASINSQMMTQKELIQAGFDSELAIAREYAQLNLMKLSEERYQMAVTNAENFAKLTGYWISPETKDVMSNYFAAESLPDGDPRKEAIMTGVDLYLKAQGIDEGTWIQAQEFFRSIMSFNQTIEREMAEAAKLAADRDYNLRALVDGVDPVTGERVVRPDAPTTDDKTPTALPPVYTSEDGSEFTRYTVEGTDGYIYFDEEGNAYEAVVDDEGNITMELREEGALKVVDGIEYFLDENGIYRDAEGYDISQHPTEGNTRRINEKLHTYTDGKWVLHSMYAKAEENWGKIQVFQKTGTTPVNVDTGTKPSTMHRRDWEAVRNGYYEEGELIKLLNTNSKGDYDTYAPKFTHYFVYQGQLYEINNAGIEQHASMIDQNKNNPGHYAAFMSTKASTVLSGSAITVAGMLTDLRSKTKQADAEEMGQLVLRAHQQGKLPNDTLINFGAETSWHYIDGTFRKIEDDVFTNSIRSGTDLTNFPFEGGVLVGNQGSIVPGNNAKEKLNEMLGTSTSSSSTTDRPTTPTATDSSGETVFDETQREGYSEEWTTFKTGIEYRDVRTDLKEEGDGLGSRTYREFRGKNQPDPSEVQAGDVYIHPDWNIRYTAAQVEGSSEPPVFLNSAQLRAFNQIDQSNLSDAAKKVIAGLRSTTGALNTPMYGTREEQVLKNLETIRDYDKDFIAFKSRNDEIKTIEDFIRQRQKNLLSADNARLEEDFLHAISVSKAIQNNDNKFVPFTVNFERGVHFTGGTQQTQTRTFNNAQEYLNFRSTLTGVTGTTPNDLIKIAGRNHLDQSFNNALKPPAAVNPPAAERTTVKTFSQSNAPSIAQSKNNDIWINTTTGQRYVFNSGRWLLVPTNNLPPSVQRQIESSGGTVTPVTATPVNRTPATGGGGGGAGTGSGADMANVLAAM